MMPTAGDSTTVISTPWSINERARISAVIHPAEPPPTTTMRRTVGGSAERRLGVRAASAAQRLAPCLDGPCDEHLQAVGGGARNPANGQSPQGRFVNFLRSRRTDQ